MGEPRSTWKATSKPVQPHPTMGIHTSMPDCELTLHGDCVLSTSPTSWRRFGRLLQQGGEEGEPGRDFH